MFFPKQTAPPQPPSPEPNGLEFRLRLSEETLAKLIPWVVSALVSALVGSGVLGYVHTQQSPPSADASAESVENAAINE